MPTNLDLSNYEDVVKFAVAGKLPEWQHEYMCKIAEAVQVHTRGFLFAKVNTLYPNEHPASKEHCLDAYEPITKSSIWKGINNINRIFTNSSFAINTGERSTSYIDEHRFNSKNLFSFFVEEWITWAIANDPNSLMVVYPPNYIDKPNYNPIKFIPHNYRIFMDSDICIFISEDESEKSYSYSGNTYTSRVFIDTDLGGLNTSTSVKKSYNQRIDVKITKKVLHIFTKEYFLRAEETKSGQYDWKATPFSSPLPEIPCYVAGGVEVERGLYDTFVNPFIPYGNLALIQHRQHTAVNLIFSFPRMSEIETPCGDCTLGWKRTAVCEEFPDGRMPCDTCKGTGFTTNQSPYKTYKRRVDPNNFGENQAANIDDIRYYTPDTAILDYSKNEWYNYLSMGEEAIFIQQKAMTGNTESAKSKEIDRDQQYAWLSKISRVMFDRLRSVVQAIENYLTANPAEVTVETPYSFAILTENEAFEALNNIINSKAPIFLKAQQVDTFTSKFVSKSSPVIKAVNVLKEVDPFLYFSSDDMETFKSNGTIDVPQWQKHILSYPLLMQMFTKDKNLFDRETPDIITELEAAIEKNKSKPETMKDRVAGKLKQEETIKPEAV